MKNFMLLALVALFFIAGCVKENPQIEPAKLTNEQALELLKARAEQRILQFEKAGAFAQNPTQNSQNQVVEDRASCNRVPICHNGNSIVVNKNAVPAHLNHGDQLTCCATSCINESAELIGGGPFDWYYDGAGNDCFGAPGFVGIAYPEGFIYVDSYTHHEHTYYYVYSHNHVNHSECYADLTQAQYVCASNYLRSYIAENSCIPNLCDFF